MSKIVIDAREYTTSTGRYNFRLIQYLEQLDHDNDYVILLKPGDMDVFSFTNPRFSKMACPHKEFTFQEQIGLLRQINSLKPDLVHFGLVQQPVLYAGLSVTTMHDLTTLRFRNTAKNPIVFTFKQQVYKAVHHWVARKSARIFTPTEFVKKDVVNYTGISSDKVTVTLESADQITDTAEPLADLHGKPFIMYVGRPQPHKNLGRLIKAFQILQQSHPDLVLVLAGKKDVLYRQYEASALAQGTSDIYFTDFVSEGQLRWLYENCAAYVFPSLSEGFGLPGLEAMRHGAPVASSSATCLPEVYGDAAEYFDPLDVDQMAAVIANVIDSPELRQKLIKQGSARIEKFSWRRMAEQTLHIYTECLKRTKSELNA